MRRREFIAIAGGAATVWPFTSSAQQVPVIGFLGSSSSAAQVGQTAFRQGLKEAGYIEGQNIAIEFRWSEGDYTRLPALAADLVSRRVAVIVASGPPAARLNSPGGNVTGVYLAFSELSAKKLGLLHDLLPQATLVGTLLNPNSPTAERQTKDLQAAADKLGLQLQIANASSATEEIDAAFNALDQKKVSAVLVGSDPSYIIQREQIINLTKRYAMPAIYELRQFVDAGGLISYGTNINDAYRVAGLYVGRILKGEKPADLPVVQETKFELVINMKTAKSLGIIFPAMCFRSPMR
jgi:putative tryptophan/tyrosine transport system substrate-binding protein